MRKLTMLVFLVVSLLVTSVVFAQRPPPIIDDLLADLSIRFSRVIRLEDLENWSWEELVFDNASLGCPAPNVEYAPQSIRGYQFDLIYLGITYDYRISFDGQMRVLCSPQTAVTATPGGAVIPSLVTTPLPVECPGAPPPRLSVGVQARVTPGLPNNIRAAAGASSAFVGEIPGNGEFTVLGGPQCAGAMLWWQVSYNDLVGWTPEGQGGDYWVEPLIAVRIPITNDNVLSLTVLNTFISGGVNQMIWSTGGGVLAVTQAEAVRLYTPNAPDIPPVDINTGLVNSLAFNIDGTRLAVANPNNTVTVWDIDNQVQVWILIGHTQPVSGLDWNINTNLIASGSLDGIIRLWNGASGIEEAALGIGGTSSITSVAFTDSGLLAAVGGLDGTVSVWETTQARNLRYAFQAHRGATRTVAFSPDGNFLATGGDDGNILIWNMVTGQLERTLEGHESSVLSLDFSPDGALLASGGGSILTSEGDNSLRIWSIFSGAQLVAFAEHSNAITRVAFSPDGGLLATSSKDNTTLLWGLPSG